MGGSTPPSAAVYIIGMKKRECKYGIVMGGVYYELVKGESCSQCSLKKICADDCICDVVAKLFGLENDSYKFLRVEPSRETDKMINLKVRKDEQTV